MKLRNKEEIKYYYKLTENIFNEIFNNKNYNIYIVNGVKFYDLKQIKKTIKYIKKEFSKHETPYLEYIITKKAFDLADTIKEESLYNKDDNFKKMYESCHNFLNK